MNFLNKNWHRLILTAYYIFTPIFVFAATESCPAGQICNPLGSTSSIPELIKDILEKALQVGIPVIALAVIYSGFLFVAARGNSEKLNKAKDTLLYTLIGAAILLGSWAIAEMIKVTITGLSS